MYKHVSHFDICLKNKNSFYFFLIFVNFITLPRINTINGLIFFNEQGLKYWAMNMHFKPIPIL